MVSTVVNKNNHLVKVLDFQELNFTEKSSARVLLSIPGDETLTFKNAKSQGYQALHHLVFPVSTVK